MPYVGFGLGCGSLSAATDAAAKESAAIIGAAVDKGVVFLDTADFYGSGESELAIGSALKALGRNKVFISLKFGALNDPKGRMYGLDVHPDRIKNYLAHSLKRLGTDYVDLYQPARIDLAIPVEETIGAIADLVKEGYVRHVGVTQVDADTLRRAHATHPIRCVEMEYSLFNRSIEQALRPAAQQLGIEVVAFGILAHGLLGGGWTRARVATGEPARSAYIELFQKGNIEKNIVLVERLSQIAQAEGITLPQLAYAWAYTKSTRGKPGSTAHGDDLIPLIGVSTLAQFQDSVMAQNVVLSEDTLQRIEAAVPADAIAGSSFPNMQFRNGKVVR